MFHSREVRFPTLTAVLVPIRLAWFWVSNYMASIAGAFMATGLLKLRGVGGKAGWRYLFLIEGGLTLLVGLISFVMMPPGPTQTKAWYRPNGWFTEKEEVIIVNRYVSKLRVTLAVLILYPSLVYFVTTQRSPTCTTGKV